MDEMINILLFDEEETTQILTESYLKEVSFPFTLSKFKEFDEDFIPKNDTKKIIIVNINTINTNILEKISRCSQNKNNYFVIISYDKSADLKVKALRVGAKEFLEKPLIKTDFVYAMQALYKNDIKKNTSDNKSNINIVVSTKKESGKTFFAFNLAKEIADVSKCNVLLLDFNNSLNDISSYTRFEFTYNTPWFINKFANTDDNIFKHAQIYPNSSLYVIGTGMKRNEVYEIDNNNVEKFLNKAREHFKYIIIDLNGDLPKTNEIIKKNADTVFCIMEPDLSLFMNSKNYIHQSFGNKDVKIILNKYNQKKDEKMITHYEQAVEQKIFFKIPKNYLATNSAISCYKTIKEISPQLDITQAYISIAENIVNKG